MHFCTDLPFYVRPCNPQVPVRLVCFSLKRVCQAAVFPSLYSSHFFISFTVQHFWCREHLTRVWCNNLYNRCVYRVLIHYNVVAFHTPHALAIRQNVLTESERWHFCSHCVTLVLSDWLRLKSPFLKTRVQYAHFASTSDTYIIPHGAHWD